MCDAIFIKRFLFVLLLGTNDDRAQLLDSYVSQIFDDFHVSGGESEVRCVRAATIYVQSGTNGWRLPIA